MQLPEWLKLVKGNLDNDEPEEVEILFHGSVGYDWDGGFSSSRFGAVLAGIPKKKSVTLSINSLGGRVDDGVAIYNMIKSRGNVTTKVVGYCASMASVFSQAGSKRVVCPGTMVIIHNPQASADGEQKDLQRIANHLATVKDNLVNIYAEHTKLGKRKLSQMMDETTSMDAKTAVELGFADEIAEGSPATNDISQAAAFNYFKTLCVNLGGQPASTGNNNQPKDKMKLVIAALAGLVTLPAESTEESAAPQITSAVSTLVAERDKLKKDNEAHAAALKLRVENRVAKAIEEKKVKAERKDSLITMGLTNEANLDFLDDITVTTTAPPVNRGAKPAPAKTETDGETVESLRASLADASPSEKSVIAKKLRGLRGHKDLFVTATN